MMVGKEDLGLSLSLGPQLSTPHHFHWPTDIGRGLRGIDVNRAPSGAGGAEEEEEEAAGASSSPNSAVSSVLSGGKRADHHEEINCSDEDADGDGSRKKLRLSKDQSAVLEESFKEHNTLNPKQKVALAKKLRLRARQVEVWFQNRRARTKLKQTEVDCGFLKRCCESLTEENRRLHKEVQELRALKLSPHNMFMHMTPPTTLTMCPSCERISPASSSAPPHHHHHHRRPPIAAVASFLDTPPQRS